MLQQCKENIYAIQTLKDFQYYEEMKDQGVNVREKAKLLVNLLKDEEKLKNERAKALKAKERFAQTGSGFGSDGAVVSIHFYFKYIVVLCLIYPLRLKFNKWRQINFLYWVFFYFFSKHNVIGKPLLCSLLTVTKKTPKLSFVRSVFLNSSSQA